MTAMASRSLHRWVLGLVAWSAFVWGNRLVNLQADDASAGEWAVSGTLSVVSLALAAAAAVVAVRAWRSGWPPPSGGERRLLGVLVAWTVGVWVVRGIDIALDWRSAGFVIVHLVLAAVSIVLAAAVWRRLGATGHGVAEPGDDLVAQA